MIEAIAGLASSEPCAVLIGTALLFNAPIAAYVIITLYRIRNGVKRDISSP